MSQPEFTLQLRYVYDWNEDVPDSEKDSTEHPSRPFCKKIMELDRVYSRGDIEQMSARLGYSVYDSRGGDGCRHRWKSVIVMRDADK